MSRVHADPARPDTTCNDCPAAALSRRAFLRDLGVAAGAAIAATAIMAPGAAFAQTVAEIAPLARRKVELSYAFPRGDGVLVDDANNVMLARWQGRAYAFSIRCPHKGARLEWRGNEGRVFCPKHKARFAPDGAHVSGRGSRALDRYALRRSGAQLIVDTSRVLRADRDAAEWSRATVILG